MTTDNEKKLPVETLRDGSIKATIWENQGENGTWHSVEISRTYKVSEGEYRDTNSYSATELLKVSHLAQKAYDYVSKLKNEKASS